MAVVGIGVDVVDVDRFAAVLTRTPALAARVLTPAERDRPVPSLAARFAAKEALAKALGAPTGLRWHDVAVTPDTSGRPTFLATGTVERALAHRGVTSTHLSLSHDGGLAMAMVVLEA
jgi:holo-[acyl-carrier protein] synthase